MQLLLGSPDTKLSHGSKTHTLPLMHKESREHIKQASTGRVGLFLPLSILRNYQSFFQVSKNLLLTFQQETKSSTSSVNPNTPPVTPNMFVLLELNL